MVEVPAGMKAEMIADAVATALASVSVAYTHATLADMTTAGRSWKVHDSFDGDPFAQGIWLGEFDNKADAHALAAKLRRERAVAAAAAALTPPTTPNPVEAQSLPVSGEVDRALRQALTASTGFVALAQPGSSDEVEAAFRAGYRLGSVVQHYRATEDTSWREWSRTALSTPSHANGGEG